MNQHSEGAAMHNNAGGVTGSIPEFIALEEHVRAMPRVPNGGIVIPLYDYLCPLGHETEQRGGYDDDQIACPQCDKRAKRRAAYLEQSVINLPTRGPLLPKRPHVRSTQGENTTAWKEILDETAHEQYQHDKQYGRGGEYSRGYDDKPTTAREQHNG